MYLRKIGISLTAGVLLGSVGLFTANSVKAYTDTNERMEAVQPQENVEVQTFTNKQLFDALEAEGYELTEIYTEEEIESALAQDKLAEMGISLYAANGVTKTVTTGTNTYRVYLNSYWTTAINLLGAGAFGVISFLLGTNAVGSFFSGMLGSMAGGLDTSRGIYIDIETHYDTYDGTPKDIPYSWGYQ